MAGQPEIMIMADYFNYHVKDSVMCDVKWMNPKKNNTSFQHLKGKEWKLKAITRGKETKIIFENEEDRYELLLHHFKAGCFIYIPPQANIAETVSNFDENIEYERDHRFSFLMKDGSWILHVDRFHQSHWKWIENGKWPPYRSPDIVFEYSAFRRYIYKYHNNPYFKNPVYEVMMHKWFFNGFNNLVRCEVLSRASFSPFLSMYDVLSDPEYREELFELSKLVIEQFYMAGGAQMSIWKNPFGRTMNDFNRYLTVYYRTKCWLIDTRGNKLWVRDNLAFELMQHAVDKELQWSKRHRKITI